MRSGNRKNVILNHNHACRYAFLGIMHYVFPLAHGHKSCKYAEKCQGHF